MWFKNLIVYKLTRCELDAETLENKLAAKALQPCSGLELSTRGWVSVKGEGQPFVHVLGAQWMICLGMEKKLLPSSVVNQFAKARALEIEEREGYKPGRKQMKELKEQITDELLPRAFAIQSRVYAWIDPVDGWLVIDSGSGAKADDVVGLLMKSVDGLGLQLLKTKLSPVSAMTGWLGSGEGPYQFTVDQDCELRGRGEAASTVRYVRHALEMQEIASHIKNGKDVTKLAMTWANRISLVLHENLQIKKLNALDVLKEKAELSADEDTFDSDFALMTGELKKLIPAMVDALGGPLQAS